MPVTVKVPTALRKLTGGEDSIEAQGASITEIIADLEARYPGFNAKLYDGSGALRRFINIFVNGEDIRFLDGANTAVTDGAEISIVPSIAGG